MANKDFNPDELDAAIYSCLQMNKQHINKEKLQCIHKDCNVMYNSVNVLCGRQGSGKTFTSVHVNERINKNIYAVTRDSLTCDSVQR